MKSCTLESPIRRKPSTQIGTHRSLKGTNHEAHRVCYVLGYHQGARRLQRPHTQRGLLRRVCSVRATVRGAPHRSSLLGVHATSSRCRQIRKREVGAKEEEMITKDPAEWETDFSNPPRFPPPVCCDSCFKEITKDMPFIKARYTLPGYVYDYQYCSNECRENHRLKLIRESGL